MLIAFYSLHGKYSTVENVVFGEAQENFGKKKLLKAAATRWLLHGESSKRLVLQYSRLLMLWMPY